MGRAAIVCIYGPIKSGKSKLIERLIATSARRCLVIDYLGDLSDDPLVVPPAHDLVELGAAGGRDGYRAAIELGAQQCWNETGRVLVLDELDLAIYKGESLAYELSDYYRLLNAGRHRDCGTITGTRRPAAIPPDIRDIATDIFVFRPESDNDLKYFKEIGIPPEVLTSLPQYHYIHRCSGTYHVHSGLWTPCPNEE